MDSEHRKSTKAQLALALAQGASAAKWARNHNVPKVTAYRWAKDPSVRKAVETYRRRRIDRAIGLMTKHTVDAADTIVRIVSSGESDSVRLRASRAIFSDIITVSKYSLLENRLHGMEEKLDLIEKAASSPPE